jgi:hypothetical protein
MYTPKYSLKNEWFSDIVCLVRFACFWCFCTPARERAKEQKNPISIIRRKYNEQA